MSLRDRLFNVAKAEIRDAARKIWPPGGRSSLDDELDLDRDDGPAESLGERRTSEPRETAEVRRWYANLELPIGAPLSEVKASYRRLMRRYHPDKHQEDPTKEKAATELAQRLREAYDGLTAHLDRK
jgi:DnaJ-domain-containing protein 1